MGLKLRRRAWTRGGLAGLMVAGILAFVPAAPAVATQSIGWDTTPPTSASLGQSISFRWSGVSSGFDPLISGCFVNFPDGTSWSSRFSWYTSSTWCSYTNKTVNLAGNYQLQVGFFLSNGSQLTRTWDVSVQPPTPTVYTSGNQSVTATSVSGASASYSAYGYDYYYGTYAASCSPAPGTVLPMGTSTVTCSTTSPGGGSASAQMYVTVTKADPIMDWGLTSSVPYGTTYADLMTASMQASDAAGSIAYTTADGSALVPSDLVPVGTNQTIRATYQPSGPAAHAYNSVTVARAITVEQSPQTVDFSDDTPTDKSYGDEPFTVSADGTSGGGDVTITAGVDSACTVAQTGTGTDVDATVTITGAGACVLLADQAATVVHTAAPTAQASVTVAKHTTSITWPPSWTLGYGNTLEYLVTATADAEGTFAYTVNGQPVDASTVLDAGPDQAFVATFTPSQPDNATGATATGTVWVLQAQQTVTIGAIDEKTYGDAPFDLELDGSGPGTVTTSAEGACTVDGVEVTLVAAGDCTVTASRAGTSNYLASDPVTETFTIAQAVPDVTWDEPDSIPYGTALGDDQLDATVTGDLPGGFVYTLADGTPAVGQVLDAGDHELTATWTPVDPGWSSATKTVTLHVDRAVPTITWPTPASVAHGVALGADQLNAVADTPGTMAYTVDSGSTSASGQVLAVGDHVLLATFTPDDTTNYLSATQGVPITVTGAVVAPDNLGPDVQHQIDGQRVETQADLNPGQTRTLSVTCPSGYVATDGSGRVDAVDQGTGTLADVHVLESRSTSPDTWTVTMANRATGRAQGKVFADCVQADTSSYDGHRHALVVDPAVTQVRSLSGPTSITVSCAEGSSPIAPGYALNGDAVVRRSAIAGSDWTVAVVPTGAERATTGSFSARCLADRVATSAGHDHRLVLRQAGSHVTVGAGEVVEAQTTCGDLDRGIVGGWSLDDGLVLAGAEPRAKTRATRLFNPTHGTLSADLSVLCLETHTEGGSDGTVVPPVPPSAAPTQLAHSSVASPSSSVLTVSARGRAAAAVACGSGTTGCTGTVSLVALRTQKVAGRTLRKGTVLATGTFAVAAGGVDKVVLRPTRRGQRALHAAGLRRAELRIGTRAKVVRLRR